ncbi:MAG: sensor histidine kinase [Candidatus Polarisedimenticolia bacterium]
MRPARRPRPQEQPAGAGRIAVATPDPGERLLALLVESVRECGIILLDAEGRVRSWNRGAERLTGYTAGEAIGRHISLIHPPEEVGQETAAAGLRAAATRGGHEEEGWRVRRDGSRFRARVEIVALRDRDGRLLGFGEIARDPGHRPPGRGTADPEEAAAELESFTFTLIHDLRAPLRAAQGFAAALLEDHAANLPPEGVEYARRIVASTTRMDRLMQDLLAYNRMVSSRIVTGAQPLDAVVQDTLAGLRDAIERRGAQVEAVGPWPAVMAHRSTLATILTQLVDNALKFVAPEIAPRIRLRAEPRDGAVRVWVEDNGIGVPAAHQDRIFRPFEKLHGVEAYSGSGIGLAMVRRGAARMAGTTGVEPAPGGGSRFWIELPAASGVDRG